jgi:hypothetical protein
VKKVPHDNMYQHGYQHSHKAYRGDNFKDKADAPHAFFIKRSYFIHVIPFVFIVHGEVFSVNKIKEQNQRANSNEKIVIRKRCWLTTHYAQTSIFNFSFLTSHFSF